MTRRAVVIGAGALGLGFVAERLASDYTLCLADLRTQEGRLSRLAREQSYTANLCSLEGVSPRLVQGNISVAFAGPSGADEVLRRELEQAELILTVTSRRLLDQIVPWLAEILNGSGARHYLLFCENGRDIARSFAHCFDQRTVLVDTVMSRMCRLDAARRSSDPVPQPAGYAPLWSGEGEALIVEDYAYWPLDAAVCDGGPFSSAFSLVPPEEFLLWEDIKLYLHNGMHAFVAYQAYLQGTSSFAEVSDSLRQDAKQTMLAEVIPAILRTHTCARREELEGYGEQLLARFFNPFFADTIERGVRGVQDKLAPDERLVGGCEYIGRAGITPMRYAHTVAAAEAILNGRCSANRA